MKIFLISLTVISSVLIIITILLQQGKGADLGASFGRGAQGGLFTSAGKPNFLTRITSGLVTVFLLSALALSVLVGNSNESVIAEELKQSSEAVSEIESLDGTNTEGESTETSAESSSDEIDAVEASTIDEMGSDEAGTVDGTDATTNNDGSDDPPMSDAIIEEAIDTTETLTTEVNEKTTTDE